MLARPRSKAVRRRAISACLAAVVARDQRIVVHQRVEHFRRLRRQRPGFQRAVIEIVGAAIANRLGVGVGILGLADQNLLAHRAHCADFAIRAGGDGAAGRNLQPLRNVAILADALPDFIHRLVDGDLHRDGNVGGILDRARDRGRRSIRSRGGGSLLRLGRGGAAGRVQRQRIQPGSGQPQARVKSS